MSKTPTNPNQEIAAHPTSHTGRFLKPVLEGRGASVAPELGGKKAPRKKSGVKRTS